MDQELLRIQHANYVTRARRASWQSADAADERHGRHFEIVTSYQNPTPSIDAYFLEKQSCRISSCADLKRLSLGLFKNVKSVAPTRIRAARRLAKRDQFLIQKYRRCDKTLKRVQCVKAMSLARLAVSSTCSVHDSALRHF